MELKIQYDIKNIKTWVQNKTELRVRSYEVWINGEFNTKVVTNWLTGNNINLNEEELKEIVLKERHRVIMDVLANFIWPR